MNYTQEDLIKIKQLVGTTDMNNVRVGIQIAKGLGVSIDVLMGLFSIDDVVIEMSDFTGKEFYALHAFGNNNHSLTDKYGSYHRYKKTVIGYIEQLLNE